MHFFEEIVEGFDVLPEIDEDHSVESAQEGNFLPALQFEVEEDRLIVDFQAGGVLLCEHALLELQLAICSIDDLSDLRLAVVLMLDVLERDVVVEIV